MTSRLVRPPWLINATSFLCRCLGNLNFFLAEHAASAGHIDDIQGFRGFDEPLGRDQRIALGLFLPGDLLPGLFVLAVYPIRPCVWIVISATAGVVAWSEGELQ